MPLAPPYTIGPLLGPDFPLPLDHPFTTLQARGEGVSEKTLARLHRDGYLRRMLRGVYVAAQTVDSLPLRAQALALVVPEHAAVVDWTAVWLYTGLLPPGQHHDVPPVSLFREAGHHRLRNQLCQSGERTLLRDDVQHIAGLAVTTPIRTAWDVGRLVHRDNAIGALDALLRTGTFTHPQLLDGLGRFRGMRGVVQLRYLASIADPRAESPGESLLRLRWLDLPGMPEPIPQVPVEDEEGRVVFRLDLGSPDLRYAAEYDGAEFHSLDADVEHDLERRTWIEVRRGWVVDVFRRKHLVGPLRDVEDRLTIGTERARLNLARPLPPPRRGRFEPPRRV
ncbi:type IV toxin-antitoxin system AbiEi family antitoxin domain-containing protein [Nocardioides iriomotensis]|uniref:AbiEi antitoxin N-terminal domain-containing protein n=1 Tax=Nocardioides iriomotensis TaxID=715784 RepID=A0A4Q5IX73_9ACTN|nr:type IV toxin-antitoxin system AbiEi family antitoxin domain-containing protein [Nocardioides iriomotensis]RYU10702.1 hypothetical protein ETU37_15700 [Nocardioides iriomotensis]